MSASAVAGEVVRVRRLVLPEGVPVDLELASLVGRLTAFVLDTLIQLAAIVLLAVCAGLVGGQGLGLAAAELGLFLLRSLYFLGFELRRGAATPGKRAAGLRVIARDGGPLTPGALVARNLTRELETTLPLVLLLDPGALGWSGSNWLPVLGSLWLLALGVLPLLNRDRLRLGDLLGGTLVVRAPVLELDDDPAASRRARRPGRGELPRFSAEQLDHYGVQELQVLEDLLRQRRDDPRALETVATTIQERIGWSGHAPADLEFLQAFYRAQRERLERDLVLEGEARARKREGRRRRRRRGRGR